MFESTLDKVLVMAQTAGVELDSDFIGELAAIRDFQGVMPETMQEMEKKLETLNAEKEAKEEDYQRQLQEKDEYFRSTFFGRTEEKNTSSTHTFIENASGATIELENLWKESEE